MLYFVATPIGNLKDISYRAIEVLGAVDCIYAENPRHSLVLLNAYNLKKPVFLYEKFSERQKEDEIIQKLKAGSDIALISDAGTPLVCDPGGRLVEALVREDLDFTVIPGACAAVSALVLSGLDASMFLTVGFLPTKQADRQSLLARLKHGSATMIFYSAVHDVQKDLASLYDAFGARAVSLVREMTKKFEQVVRFRLGETPSFPLKGEFVLVVEGQPQDHDADKTVSVLDKLRQLVACGADKKEAVKIVATEYGLPKSVVYQESCKLKNEDFS